MLQYKKARAALADSRFYFIAHKETYLIVINYSVHKNLEILWIAIHHLI
ncbi:hypothetical protein PRUB_a1896 [Pseudoalteromonas rubra]|uniref:Uncharacterized protein n=1 Tax=Pseudoalteromonas rubra TaxID=43658 RepID=A0A8T0CE59_9GAMM|nr:hypothetical protein PRUB_a1896 [Pseudoalteromonas rubra]